MITNDPYRDEPINLSDGLADEAAWIEDQNRLDEWPEDPPYSPEAIEEMYQAHLAEERRKAAERELAAIGELRAEMDLFAKVLEALPDILK